MGAQATLHDLATADCVVVVGGNPLQEQKVLGYLAKRALDDGAVLIVVADQPTGLDAVARMTVRLGDIASVEGVVQAAQRPVVLYAANLAPAVYAALKAWPSRARFMPLIAGTNAAGAAKLGMQAKAVHGDVLYVSAGDEIPGGRELPQAEFTIVQAAYQTEWTEHADVVLPAQVWSEKSGHVVNVEGIELVVAPFIKAPAGIPADDVALGMLTLQMGQPQAAEARAPLLK